jgi:hypothetical protein
MPRLLQKGISADTAQQPYSTTGDLIGREEEFVGRFGNPPVFNGAFL